MKIYPRVPGVYLHVYLYLSHFIILFGLGDFYESKDEL